MTRGWALASSIDVLRLFFPGSSKYQVNLTIPRFKLQALQSYQHAPTEAAISHRIRVLTLLTTSTINPQRSPETPGRFRGSKDAC